MSSTICWTGGEAFSPMFAVRMAGPQSLRVAARLRWMSVTVPLFEICQSSVSRLEERLNGKRREIAVRNRIAFASSAHFVHQSELGVTKSGHHGKEVC